MASKSLTFHLPEEANPDVILAILETWATSPERSFNSIKELLDDVSTVREIPHRTESANFAVRLGLITKRSDGLLLTALAKALAGQRAAVQYDLMHFLAYSAWQPESDGVMVPFWSYQSTCNALWEMSSMAIEAERGRLVEHVIGTSQEQFADHPLYDPDHVSYSPKSLRAILKWLDPLTPSVIVNGSFQRRSACSSELLLLALGQAYRTADAEPRIELLLTGRVREAICRLCLIDPTYLDRLLDWALARHNSFVDAADQSGTYGRSVRLRSLPTVENVLTGRLEH